MRSSFDGLHLKEDSPTSLNSSDQIAQLPLEKWTLKEVETGHPLQTVANPLDRLEGARCNSYDVLM
jgi:hypothetical protein